MSARRGGRRWTELAKRVIAEEPLCRICGLRPSTTADHIVPVALGGAEYDRENVRGACQRCNYAGGARITNARRGQRRLGSSPLRW